MYAIPMGQEVTTTAMQLAGAISAIANNGDLVRPRIVKYVVDAGGKVVKEPEPRMFTKVISAETSEKMRSILKGVVDVGTGKKAKGIAEGLGVKNARYVNSPTFVIIKEYKAKLPLYHFDLYRLEHHSSLDDMNYEEYFYGDGVTVIEWADKIRALLPKKYTEVRFSITGEDKRKINIL